MKTYIQLLLIVCLSSIYSSIEAQDMSGEWNGVLRQSDGGPSTSYYFTLNLKHKGNVITGNSKISFVEHPEFYGIMELKGIFKNDILTFRETKIVSQNVFTDLEWCFKKAKLNFTMKKDGFCIEGTWSGKTAGGGACAPGTLKMCKIVPIACVQPNKINQANQQGYNFTAIHRIINTNKYGQEYFRIKPKLCDIV